MKKPVDIRFWSYINQREDSPQKSVKKLNSEQVAQRKVKSGPKKGCKRSPIFTIKVSLKPGGNTTKSAAISSLRR